jgi:hypothetical protein
MEEKTKERQVTITGRKAEQLIRQPVVETQVSKSQDGKWIVHKTIITDIKPIAYMQKVLG